MKKYLLVFVLTVALVLVVVTAVAGAANTQTPDKLVLNITYKVLNNPDSGVAGNYWALDEMNRHVQVWQTGPTSYRAVVSDEGKFTTFVGTTSPGGTGTIASEVTGTLHGGYDATSFSQFLPSVGQNGGLALHYGFLALCAVVALIVILRERSAEGRELPGARGLTPSGREGPWPSWTAHDLPPAGSVTSESAAAAPGIVWPTPGATVPPGSPGATTGPPPLPAGLTPVSTPPAPPSPQVAGSVGGRAAFVPPLCRRCGAIVVGDIQGFPMRCPRCGEPLPLAGEAPSLAISRVFPEPQAAPGPSPSVAPVSWPPPSVPSVRSGVGHPEEFEDLPEGAWPPLPASGRGLSHTILLASGPGPGP